MNNYPGDAINHNLPLLVVSGLSRKNGTDDSKFSDERREPGDGGFHIKIEAELVTGRNANALSAAFSKLDASAVPWSAQAPQHAERRHVYAIRHAGRVGQHRSSALQPDTEQY